MANYAIRRGDLAGRYLQSLTAAEMKTIIHAPPKVADCRTGVKVMDFILAQRGPAAVIDFVAWGKQILEETGQVNPSDFIPDKNSFAQKSLNREEKKLLRLVRPPVYSRRSFLLGVIPWAAVGAVGGAHILSRMAELSYDKKYNALRKSEEAAEQAPANPFRRTRQAIDEINEYPVETIVTVALAYEFIRELHLRDKEAAEEMSNAIAYMADMMGIGKESPKYRLPPKAPPSR